MMRFVHPMAAALVALAMTAAPVAAQDSAPPAASETVVAQAKGKARANAPRNIGTHVYLLRGFMDIFSTGMDDLGVKLTRRGIRASVHNHSEFQALADGIIERHRRGIRENVVIIGHSLGGNDAFRMAERLGQAKITVPLIISYDPTASMSAPVNVSRVVNFFSSTNGWGAPILPGAGFRGTLNNIDLSRRGEIGHTDIDKSPALHSQSINYIQSIGGGRRATEATAAPAGEQKGQKGEATAAAAPAATEANAGGAAPQAAASPAENAPAAAAPATDNTTETAASDGASAPSSN